VFVSYSYSKDARLSKLTDGRTTWNRKEALYGKEYVCQVERRLHLTNASLFPGVFTISPFPYISTVLSSLLLIARAFSV